MTEPTIAEVMISQFDGPEPRIPGAHGWTGMKGGVVFQLATAGPHRAHNAATHVQVKLAPRETYEVTFIALNRKARSAKRIASYSGVMFDQIPAAVIRGAGIGANLEDA